MWNKRRCQKINPLVECRTFAIGLLHFKVILLPGFQNWIHLNITFIGYSMFKQTTVLGNTILKCSSGWCEHISCWWSSLLGHTTHETFSYVVTSSSLPAMQWHAHKRLFAFLSGNLAPLFLRLQYVLNVFIFRSFVKSLSMPIDSLLTTIFFLETKSLPSIPTKRYESEPDLPKPKLLLPNAGRSNRHCLSIEKTSNRQRRGKLTMSSRLAGWSPRLC